MYWPLPYSLVTAAVGDAKPPFSSLALVMFYQWGGLLKAQLNRWLMKPDEQRLKRAALAFRGVPVVWCTVVSNSTSCWGEILAPCWAAVALWLSVVKHPLRESVEAVGGSRFEIIQAVEKVWCYWCEIKITPLQCCSGIQGLCSKLYLH